jgi:hypothetical protein
MSLFRSPLGQSRAILTAVALGAVAIACGDQTVRKVDTGMSREQAIAILTGDSGASVAGRDTFKNVHRRSRYLIDRKEMEVLWFTPTGAVPGKDTLPFRELTPIVVFDGKVIGKGWDFWEKTAAQNNIPVPPKDTTK